MVEWGLLRLQSASMNSITARFAASRVGKRLDAVAEELNDRPRKTLGWRKPSEVFLGLINDSLTA